MVSFTPDVFEDVGLIVFDECHLLHPRNMDTSRRSIDAMLCLLNLNRLAPTADILLLSAMMKNTLEIAGWLQDLTARPCLGLDLTWKPTRQVRGCVVYASERLGTLQGMLAKTRRAVPNKNAPVEVKAKADSASFRFFLPSANVDFQGAHRLRAAPAIGRRRDIVYWHKAGWTLVSHAERQSGKCRNRCGDGLTASEDTEFAQTIPLCKSTCDAINTLSGPQALSLTEEEQALYRIAVEEAGGSNHLYLTMTSEGLLADASACHHGLLILQERQLHEDLFRRANGVNVMVATSTLAQGMNLPSEVVIIAGDSRFNQDANRMERLEAHELLNAAGRAGRAGEVSQGFVLIVPSKVVDFESNTNSDL